MIGDTIQDPVNEGDSISEGDSNNGNDNTNGENDADDIDSENESEVFIGSANGDDNGDAPVGWIVTSVLLSAIFCVLCALFVCAKRNKKEQAAPRSVDCKIIPASQDDELNKMYEAKLHADDLSVDTDDESGEIAYAVADMEQRSS